MFKAPVRLCTGSFNAAKTSLTCQDICWACDGWIEPSAWLKKCFSNSIMWEFHHEITRKHEKTHKMTQASVCWQKNVRVQYPFYSSKMSKTLNKSLAVKALNKFNSTSKSEPFVTLKVAVQKTKIQLSWLWNSKHSKCSRRLTAALSETILLCF